MDPENKKSDAEEILSEFQKTHGDEPVEEPQVEAEPQVGKESEPAHQTHNMIFIGTKPIMTYVTAALTRLSPLSILTIKARGKRITQAIDVSQMIVKRMNEVGFAIDDVRILSDLLVSKDGQKRSVSTIEIDVKNTSKN